MYVIKFKSRQEVSNWLASNPACRTILIKYLEENLSIDISKQENIIDCLESINLATLGTFYDFVTKLPISKILKYDGLKLMSLQTVTLRIKDDMIAFNNRLVICSQKCMECKNFHIC